jgi:hypothetical protein
MSDDAELIKQLQHWARRLIPEEPAAICAKAASSLSVLSDFFYDPRTGRSARDGERTEDLKEAIRLIIAWAEAYPLDIFPEPDLKKARELLEAGGITLDAVSAHAMRHVLDGVAKIAREALKEGQEP